MQNTCINGLFIKNDNIKHEDFHGHKGIFGPSDFMWIATGKGIILNEMMDSVEACTGLQLLVNQLEPYYQ